MARPRQGEGIKRTIRQKGDKFYAYEITSRMVDGEKRTVSKYLGRVDPVTGDLMDKIPEKTKAGREKIAKQRNIAVLHDVEHGDFGGVYLLDAIQRRIGLGDDLNRSFGNSCVTMLAVAETLVQCHGVFDAVEGTLRRTWTRRFYGLAGSLDSGSLSHITEDIGIRARANMEKFFALRIARTEGIIAWDTTTIGVSNDMGGMAEYVVNNKDGEDQKQVKLGFATNLRGVPLMYRYYAGNVSDMDTLRLFSSDVERYGGRNVLYVMDRGFCSGWNMRYMLRNGYRFVMPAHLEWKAVKRLLTEFNGHVEKRDLEYDEHMYKVWTTEVGIRPAEGRTKVDGDQAYELTLPGDDGHGSEGTVTAFVCFDSKKFSDEVQARSKMISDLKKKAAAIDAKDPVAEFKKAAGKAAKYFDIEADGRKVRVTERRNSKSFEENRAGLFVMLATPGTEWHVMMAAYDARRLTEQAFDAKKGESPRFGTGNPDSMQGREFLRFLDLILRCEIAAEIREAGMTRTLSVEQAVSMADCVGIRGYRGEFEVTEIDKAERRIFEALDIPVPKEPVMDVFCYDIGAA